MPRHIRRGTMGQSELPSGVKRMPNPFPGMNPYLEQPGVWVNFHAHALPVMVEQLVPQVVPAYIARLEEQLYIHDLPAEPRLPAEPGRFLGRADLAVGLNE